MLSFFSCRFLKWSRKLIVLRNITSAPHPPPTIFHLPPLLFSITWNLGKVLILRPADWLAGMLSCLLTLCQALIICYRLTQPPNPPPRCLLRPRFCCRCSFWKHVWLIVLTYLWLHMHWKAGWWGAFGHNSLLKLCSRWPEYRLPQGVHTALTLSLSSSDDKWIFFSKRKRRTGWRMTLTLC